MVDFGVHHLPLPGGAPAPKKWGSLSPPPPLPCGATTHRARGARTGPAPHGALLGRIWAIRANPRPMRVSGHSLDHDGEGLAL